MRSYLVLQLRAPEIFTLGGDNSNEKIDEDILFQVIYHHLWKFSRFDASNAILFQTNVFCKNIKKTTLASYFTNVTVRPSFTRLGVIKRVNGIDSILKLKICYKDSTVSPSYLNLLSLLKYNETFKHFISDVP